MAVAELSKAPTSRMTWEEYLDWLDEDTFAEWVDGEVVTLSPVSLPHSPIASFLDHLIMHFVALYRLGEVHREPFLMRLAKVRRGRMPDILFVSYASLGLLTDQYLD